MKYFSSFINLIFLVLIFTFLFLSSVNAQIVDCSTTHQSGVFHIYLDELSAVSNEVASKDDVKELMEKLVFKLNTVAEGVSTEIFASAPCYVNYCEKRKPRDVSVFNTSLVEHMHDNDVILEIWGTLDQEQRNDSLKINKAHIYYLLVPVWINTNQVPTRPGVQTVVYTSGDSIITESHLDLLSGAPQMRIYIEAGLGINYLLNDQYNSARKFICSSLTNLEKYLKSKVDSQPNLKEQALKEYLKQVSKEIIIQAKSNSNYEGFLTEIDENTECLSSDIGGIQ